MPESGSESPQVRRFRRSDPKEYREAKRGERKQRAEGKKIERKQALSALSKDKPEVADRTDLENLANLEQPTTSPPDANINNQPEISTPRQEIINAEEVVHDASSDKWKGSGSLRMNGDYLSYLPEIKRRENPFVPGNKYHDNFEKYGVDYDPEEFPYSFRKDMKKNRWQTA